MSLNQLFPTDDKINEIKELIRNGKQLPKKYREFQLNSDDDLVYVPLNLIVIPKAEVEQELTKLYRDDVNMLAKGVKSVYKYITSKYINITRNEVAEFLSRQKDFQLTRNIRKVVNKPIIEKKPNNRWQVDCIDMEKYLKNNDNRRYIFNCVDIFSRKIWLRALNNLEAKTTANAISNIIAEAGVKPNIIQCDNGVEFQGDFKKYLEENDITQIFNNPYTPNENAIVERSNQEVRKIIRTLMLADNSLRWYDKLDQVEEHRNNAYNESIKAYPNQVWSPDKDKVSPRTLPESVAKENPKLLARVNIAKKALKTIKKYKQIDNYEVGDQVRIKMSAIFNNIRKLLKEGNSKQIVVSYTPEVFTVNKVIQKSGVLERNKYLIENNEGNILTKANGKNKYFYASDLLSFNDGEPSNITMKQALKLNKVETNENDAVY